MKIRGKFLNEKLKALWELLDALVSFLDFSENSPKTFKNLT
jgi:hypothetical protein